MCGDGSYESPLVSRSFASSPDSSLSHNSLLMLYNHLRFFNHLLLFPVTILPTYPYSLLNTCPYHFNLLSCTFLDILFSHLRCLSNAFTPRSIQLGHSTQLFQNHHFHHIQLFLLRFLHYPLGTVHHCWS